MIKRIKEHHIIANMLHSLGTRTGVDTQIVFSGELVAAVLGFVANVILLRKMSVENYGLLSLFLSLMMFTSGMMHLGWVDTYVRFGAKYLGSVHFSYIRKFCLKKSSYGMVALFSLIAGGSGLICAKILNRPGQELLIIGAGFGAIINILFSYTQNDYRVQRKFKNIVQARVGSALLRIAGFIISTLVAGSVSLIASILINLFSLIAFTIRPFFQFFRSENTSLSDGEKTEQIKIKQEMSQYNFWILISYIATTIIGNVDMQILSHFHSNQALGNFGAATRLTLPFQMMVSALTTTLLPRLSMVIEHSDMRTYLKKVSLFIIPTALLLIVMIFLAPPILIWTAGPSYAGISMAIKLQLAATLVMFLANPFGLVLNAWGWSKFFAILNIFQLVLDIVLDLLWIPKYGVEGALMATLVINAVGLVVVYIGLWVGFRRNQTIN